MTKRVSNFSIFLVSLALSAACGAREFEDQFGRMIVAELVSHTGEDAEMVTIDRGGKEFEVKVSIFSAKDQEFIRDWMKSTSPKINYAFRIETTKKKLSETRSGSGRRRGRTKIQQYTYEIKITSLCRQPVKDLSVEYHAYMANNRNRFSSSSDIVQIGDKVDIKGPLKYNHTATLQTKTFSLDSFRSYYYYSSTVKDSLLGVLVRVYDPDGNVVADYRSASSKFKNIWPTKGGTTVTIE